jgi:hypothetical protein
MPTLRPPERPQDERKPQNRVIGQGGAILLNAAPGTQPETATTDVFEFAELLLGWVCLVREIIAIIPLPNGVWVAAHVNRGQLGSAPSCLACAVMAFLWQYHTDPMPETPNIKRLLGLIREIDEEMQQESNQEGETPKS